METSQVNVLEKIIDTAKKKGADQSDVILSRGESISLSAQDAQIDKYKVSGSQVVGLRVIKDQKVGLSYTESFDSESIENTVLAALENASNGRVNEYEVILKEKGEVLSPYKKTSEVLSIEKRIEFCLNLESEVKQRDVRVASVPYNGHAEQESSLYYLNSNGFFGFKSDSFQTCYTSALISENGQSSMHYKSSIARSMNDLEVDHCMSEVINHASSWLGAGPLKTGHYDVIFTVDVLGELFGAFSIMFSAKLAMEDSNPFKEKINQVIASEELKIVDVPNYKYAFFKNSFDSEGFTPQELTLVEGGKLMSFYHNCVTANYFKTQTTGHASRSAKSALGLSGTSKIISSGKSSDEQINSGEYFEVHSLQGLHSGANKISGEFSFAASGYLCKDGVQICPVKGVTVSGNFYKMLSRIRGIGQKSYSSSHRDFFSPRIRFEDLSIAGS